jgi:hypothetical protein
VCHSFSVPVSQYPNISHLLSVSLIHSLLCFLTFILISNSYLVQRTIPTEATNSLQNLNLPHTDVPFLCNSRNHILNFIDVSIEKTSPFS